jgi:hypothetical protein
MLNRSIILVQKHHDHQWPPSAHDTRLPSARLFHAAAGLPIDICDGMRTRRGNVSERATPVRAPAVFGDGPGTRERT